MKNNTPEYFSYITETENGTWISLSRLSEYSADGFELIGIRSYGCYHYEVEEGVRSINLTSYTCPPQSITFPSTLEEIKNIADLYDCREVENYSPNFVLENGCLYTADKSELVFVFNRLVKGDDFIYNGVKKIRDYALVGCLDFRAITIPPSAKEIGAFALHFNNELRKITIPYGVEVIKEGTFAFSDELREVELPDTITSIEDEAFLCCELLESVTLPKSLTHIGKEVFQLCNNIKSVTVNTPHFILENGILYDSAKTEIFAEFWQLIGSEVTIPKTVSRITLDHSTILDPRNNKLVTISKSSPLFGLFKEKYGLFLNIVD